MNAARCLCRRCRRPAPAQTCAVCLAMDIAAELPVHRALAVVVLIAPMRPGPRREVVVDVE